MKASFLQPRCALLTLGVPVPPRSGLFAGRTDAQFAAWFRQFPELGLLTQIVPKVIAPSTQTPGLDAWQAAATYILQHQSDIDGVVVFHDPAHIIPAGVVFDLLLQDIGVPVILTALGEARTSASWRTNLVMGLQAITSLVPGVSVLDGNRIVRAAQARLEQGLLAGSSAAKFDFGLRRVPSGKRAEWLRPVRKLERQMRIWRSVPGLALPHPTLSHAILLQTDVSTSADWSAMERWARELSPHSHVICQTPRPLPRKLQSRWGWLSETNDAVAIAQASWAFAQGARWREAAAYARQRRGV